MTGNIYLEYRAYCVASEIGHPIMIFNFEKLLNFF